MKHCIGFSFLVDVVNLLCIHPGLNVSRKSEYNDWIIRVNRWVFNLTRFVVCIIYLLTPKDMHVSKFINKQNHTTIKLRYC
jgi:hypothetical protein